jgi:hypothetical protein
MANAPQTGSGGPAKNRRDVNWAAALAMVIGLLRQRVDDNTARSIGQVYSATLLVWGWYGDEALIKQAQ